MDGLSQNCPLKQWIIAAFFIGLHRAVGGGHIYKNKEVPSGSTKIISEELEIFEEKRISDFFFAPRRLL